MKALLSISFILLFVFYTASSEPISQIYNNETIVLNDNFALRWASIFPSMSLHPTYRNRPMWRNWLAINFTSLTEVDESNNVVQKVTFKDETWVRTVEDSTLYGTTGKKISISSVLSNGASFEWTTHCFAGDATVDYGNFTFVVESQKVKWSISIVDWPFADPNNKFVLDFGYSTDSNLISINKTSLSPQVKLNEITTDTLFVFLKFIQFIMIDGVETYVDTKTNLDPVSLILFYKVSTPAFDTFYYDPDFSVLLTKDPDCSSSNWCSNHGTCYADNKCDCDNGFQGAACETSFCPDDCSSNGKCITDDPNRGPYCSCNDGWTGPDCGVANCPGEPIDCSGRGECSTKVSPPMCVCRDGWGGFDCSIATCTESENSCGSNGECNTRVDPPRCMCDSGFTGNRCEKAANCTLNADFCQNGGKCVNGACECTSEWIGSDCAIEVCPGYNSVGNCNFLGTCDTSDADAPHKCVCNTGRTGEDCSVAVCQDDCSGNGDCYGESVVPVCMCDSGFDGSNCAIKLQNSKKGITDSQLMAAIFVPIAVVASAGALVGGFLYRRREQRRRQVRMAAVGAASVMN